MLRIIKLIFHGMNYKWKMKNLFQFIIVKCCFWSKNKRNRNELIPFQNFLNLSFSFPKINFARIDVLRLLYEDTWPENYRVQSMDGSLCLLSKPSWLGHTANVFAQWQWMHGRVINALHVCSTTPRAFVAANCRCRHRLYLHWLVHKRSAMAV